MKYIIYILFLIFSINVQAQFIGTTMSSSGRSTLYDGLVAAWGLNEASGPDVYDYTTNDYDGTAINTPTFGAAGKVDDAVSFDEGSSELINFGTSFWDPGTSDLTVAVWISLTSSVDDDGIVGNWGPTPFWYLMVHSDDIIYGRVDFGGGAITTMSNSGIATDGTWYHVIYQMDRDGNASMYVNNVLQTDQDNISGSSAVSLANSNRHAVGTIGNVIAAYYFDGAIDAIQIWNRLLTSDERAENYAEWEP